MIAISDISITVAMVYFSHRAKTSFKATTDMINRLVHLIPWSLFSLTIYSRSSSLLMQEFHLVFVLFSLLYL